MHVRFWFKRDGGHTKVAMFIGKSDTVTHGRCGDLVMENGEWDWFAAELPSRPHLHFARCSTWPNTTRRGASGPASFRRPRLPPGKAAVIGARQWLPPTPMSIENPETYQGCRDSPA